MKQTEPPYTAKIKCRHCRSEYEIHCTVDNGGRNSPKMCPYCGHEFFESTAPRDPFDLTPPEGYSSTNEKI